MWALAATLVVALGLSGCPKAKAIRALGAAEVAQIGGIGLDGDVVTGRLLIRWPGRSETICVEQVRWQAEGLSLQATAEAPCEAPAAGQTPEQWLAVSTTRDSLAALGSGRPPRGSASMTASVDGVPLELTGGRGLKLRLADGCLVELGGFVGADSASLDVVGLPPRALLRIGVTNVLPVALRTHDAAWRLHRGEQTFAAGPLEVPTELEAGQRFEVQVELDAADALGLAGALLTAGAPLALEADVGLETPWGRVLLRSTLAL
jgi:hypothetical protein